MQVTILGLVLGSMFISQPVRADFEWSPAKQLNLEAAPVDLSISADGQWMFILTPDQVLIYSPSTEKVITRIPVEGAFDKLTHFSEDTSLTLVLSSSSDKTLKIIHLDIDHDISISGLPHKGPENAPVTIAIFNDYQ